MLLPLADKLNSLRSKIGRFPTMVLLSLAVLMVFCNQTVASIMVSQLSDGLYSDEEEEKYKKMLDIENTAIVLAGLIPWCIACSVPLAMIGADAKGVIFAFYLLLVPLYNFFTDRSDRFRQST